MYFQNWCHTELEVLLPGGPEDTSFDVREVWYPVHYEEDLDQAKLNRFTLLDQDLVIWWDKINQNWSVLVDQCPHRLAPLSEGRINEEGLLECPYHGWSFAGDGQCQSIPQQHPESRAETSKRACVQSLPAVISQGMLFVYPGNPQQAAKTKLPTVEPLSENPSEWLVLNTFRDIPYDAFTLLENVLDVSHIPYTHHNTVGNRKNAAPVDLEIVTTNKYGFQGLWAEGPRKGTLGKQETTFIAPNLMFHDLTSQQFGRTLTVVYATPISKGKCRLFARFPFKFPSKIPAFFIKLTPRWYGHINQNLILEDDQIFLHFQERYLEKLGGSDNINKAFYLPTKADLFVSELHNWLHNYQVNPFPHAILPPALSQELLLERYHSHTKNCASCSQALANFKKLKFFSSILLVILLSLTPFLAICKADFRLLLTIIDSVLILFSGSLLLGLTKFERKFYEGQNIPPRNFK
jgi:phenylpropionate dioxygenase-like ring-hydroxylating dioxygenase large terminal subunit